MYNLTVRSFVSMRGSAEFSSVYTSYGTRNFLESETTSFTMSDNEPRRTINLGTGAITLREGQLATAAPLITN